MGRAMRGSIQARLLLPGALIAAFSLYLVSPLVFCQKPSLSLRSRSPVSRAAVKSPWDEVAVSFRSLEDAKATLADPELFSTWGARANELLDLADTLHGSMFDLSSARQVATDLGPIHIYLVGESGAGKSTLTLALGDGLVSEVPVKISAAQAATMNNTFVPLPCGLVLVDTPGYRIPMGLTDEDEKKTLPERMMLRYMYSRQLARWQHNLRQLGRLVKETDPSKSPASAVMYVHRAGTRMVPDRLKEALSVPIKGSVPTFLVISDINAVDDRDVAEIRQVVSEIVEDVGSSPCGHRVQVLEVNSASKQVQDVNFRASGLAELVAGLLNALRPRDVLQFVRRGGLLR